jgi:ketosteroid isomerase-like protein
MSEQENVEIVREWWDAFARGDLDGVFALADPHVVMVTLEEGPLYGQDAVRKNHARWIETWEEHEATVEEAIGVRDHVFVVARLLGRGKASGVEVEQRLYDVYTLRNGRILHAEEFHEREDALEAAGLSE